MQFFWIRLTSKKTGVRFQIEKELIRTLSLTQAFKENIMFRGFMQGFVGILGVFAVFIIAAWAGSKTESGATFFFLLAIGIGCLYALRKYSENVGRIPMDDWLASITNKSYSYAWDGTGMALDEENKILHLSSKFNNQIIQKKYNFSDIREWGYNIEGHTIQTSETIIGGGFNGFFRNIGSAIGVAIANSASVGAANEKTGFWIKISDIDYPKWLVKFKPQKDLEMELMKWMEIFEQKVNS